MIRTVQAKQVKTGTLARYAGVFVTCLVFASCSSDQSAFFARTDKLISDGYTWQKLDRCRPAKEDALSIPFIGFKGQKFVCYVLVPPPRGVTTSTLLTTPAATVATTPATSGDSDPEKFGVIWNFSNF